MYKTKKPKPLIFKALHDLIFPKAKPAWLLPPKAPVMTNDPQANPLPDTNTEGAVITLGYESLTWASE